MRETAIVRDDEVDAAVQYGGFWLRAGATLIDSLLIVDRKSVV